MSKLGQMSEFPSMKARALLRVLMREPLDYRIASQRGSHRRLVALGRPTLFFAHHDRAELAPGIVRNWLVAEVGLTPAEALALLKG